MEIYSDRRVLYIFRVVFAGLVSLDFFFFL